MSVSLRDAAAARAHSGAAADAFRAATAEPREAPGRAARQALSLPAMAEAAMRAAPGRDAFRHIGAKGERTLSQLAAMREIVRLSAFLQVLKLPPRSVVAIVMPNRPEALIAATAALHAGHRPLMLPLALDNAELSDALERAGASVAITVTDAAGTDAPERLRQAAARFFGLRFVAAYGPGAPDGVISLDLLPVVRGDAALSPSLDPELDILTRDPHQGRIVARGCDGLVAKSLPILAGCGMMSGHALVSLLPPDDMAGLALTLAGPLAAGLSVTQVEPFRSDRLAMALRTAEQDPTPLHLVAPAFIAPALAASGLLENPALRSLILVDRAPWTQPDPLDARLHPRLKIADVVAVDEIGLLVGLRHGTACPGFLIAEPVPAVASGVRLLDARVEENRLWLRGPGTPLAAPAPRPNDPMPRAHDGESRDAAKAWVDERAAAFLGWRTTRFRPDMTDGRVLALHAIG